MTKAWLTIAALGLWIVAIPPLLSAVIPPSLWFQVDRIYLEDSIRGVPPRLTVDRTVHRPFRGSWDALVKAERGAVFVATDCKRYSPGAFDYRVDAVIPPGADLRWWLSIPPNPDCEWNPGRYVVETTWTIHLLAGIELRVGATSNVFTIHETGWTPPP